MHHLLEKDRLENLYRELYKVSSKYSDFYRSFRFKVMDYHIDLTFYVNISAHKLIYPNFAVLKVSHYYRDLAFNCFLNLLNLEWEQELNKVPYVILERKELEEFTSFSYCQLRLNPKQFIGLPINLELKLILPEHIC